VSYIGEADSIDAARVRLRPMKLEDAPHVHRLWAERAMLRHLWSSDYVSFEQSLAVIERSIESFAIRRAGLWCAYPHDEDLLIGFGGFWFMPQRGEPELVFGVAAARRRLGLGREIVRAVVRHGFDALGYPRILIDVPHARILDLVVRLGFTPQRPDAGAVQLYCLERGSFRDDGSAYRRLPGPQPLV
jgi:RimJ/RimL family protein N-acetyltransferase